MEKEEIKNIITDLVGINGRIISLSKSWYRKLNPNNLVVFNSNICTKEDGKLWYGDIDITISKNILIHISQKINKTIYILYEYDGRFENENNPLIDKYLICFNPDGTYNINDEYKEFYKFE